MKGGGSEWRGGKSGRGEGAGGQGSGGGRGELEARVGERCLGALGAARVEVGTEAAATVALQAAAGRAEVAGVGGSEGEGGHPHS